MGNKRKRLKARIKALKKLVRHCRVHSGYMDCGRDQMTSDEKRLYDAVIGHTDGQNSRRSETESN